MAGILITQRCANHAAREAVARCLECHGFYCRECVTEHEDRLICSACLGKLTAPVQPRRKPRIGSLVLAAQGVLGLFLLWLVFYYLAKTLTWVPAAVHEATLWAADNL